jgi:hypothetical protein
MNRRNFLKISSFAVGAAAITNLSAGTITKAFGKNVKPDRFSLELITSDEDKAIKLAENFIDGLNLNKKIVKFSDYQLNNTESADLVYIKNGKLVNYKASGNDTGKALREIADQLNLPRVITNPVRLKFYTQPEESNARHFLVFHKDKLVRKIDASESNFNLRIAGSKGDVVLNVNNRKARVTEASCRHKNCVNSGSISLADESIVCIPNEVLILAE